MSTSVNNQQSTSPDFEQESNDFARHFKHVVDFFQKNERDISRFDAIQQLLEKYKSTFNEKQYNILCCIVYKNTLSKIILSDLLFKIYEDRDKNKELIQQVGVLKSQLTERIESFNIDDIKAELIDLFTYDDVKALYNDFGIIDILRLINIKATHIEDIKDSLLLNTGKYEQDNRTWTFKIKEEGVYNIGNLLKVTELTQDPLVGVNHKVIKLYDTINTDREPVVYFEKVLPERSRVAVYNATLEKMILSKKSPCVKHHFKKIEDIPYHILNFIEYEKLHTAQSVEELISLITSEIFRILSFRYEQQNNYITNKREIGYIAYMGTYGIVASIEPRLRRELLDNKYLILPARDHKTKVEIAGVVKPIISKILQSIKIDQYVSNFEINLCL